MEIYTASLLLGSVVPLRLERHDRSGDPALMSVPKTRNNDQLADPNIPRRPSLTLANPKPEAGTQMSKASMVSCWRVAARAL